METNEKEYYELFGLEAPEEPAQQETQEHSGAEAQETAAPAHEDEPSEEQEIGEGANEQETAEPASSEPDEPSEKQQSPEERRRQAAARRQRELDSAVQSAVQQALARERAERSAEEDRFVASLGLKDPTRDNAPITTRKQYEEYQRSYGRQRADQELQRAKLSRETIEQVVSESAQMQRLDQAAQAAQAREQAARERDQLQIAERELQTIRGYDPEVQSITDLARDPQTGADFVRLIRDKNLSFVQAYILTHPDKIGARQASQAAARAEKNARGKEHLRPVSGQGSAKAPVSAEELEIYRALMPKAKDSEFESWYASQK